MNNILKELMIDGIEVEVRKLKKKTVSIEVDNKAKVVIRVPIGKKKNELEIILGKQLEWIKNNGNEIKKVNEMGIARKFKEGESVFYLGEEFNLKFSEKSKLDVKNKIIYANKENTKESLERLYKFLAKTYIIERVKYYSTNFEEKAKSIKIKAQKRRWGSCSYDNNLNFNYKIIMASREVVDYLIIHEMCHMPHKNHSSEFWNAVGKIIPNYMELRDELRKIGFNLEI